MADMLRRNWEDRREYRWLAARNEQELSDYERGVERFRKEAPTLLAEVDAAGLGTKEGG